MSPHARDLLGMSGEELDRLFRESPPGPLPDGEATGTAIVFPGGWLARVKAWAMRWFLWQGKVFDATTGTLVNRVTPFGIRAIKARYGPGESWFDGKPCTVLDYSETSMLARCVRDEIRQVAPGLYLGQVFVGRKRLLRFAVSFQYEPARTFWRRLLAGAALLAVLFGLYLLVRMNSDAPVRHADAAEHFKYGSTGGERTSGIPLAIWHAMPALFEDLLPDRTYRPERPYASFGFLYETDDDGSFRELPIGVSRRRVQGLDRVFVNCAICHAGTVRDTPAGPRRIVLGMPSNTVDLQAFERFLFEAAADERFHPARVMAAIEQVGADDDLDWLNNRMLKKVGVHLMRDQLLMLRDRFGFMDREPDAGPGRVDTFNPPKVLLNFPMDQLPEREWVGNCDLPSIWMQGAKEGMQLHWDGNNTKVSERNRSAAFGTGAYPPSLDRPAMQRIEDWLHDLEPPPYPYPIDRELAARGKTLYAQYCADCHGADGRDFSGAKVGTVEPLESIGTDRRRLDSYTLSLAVNQNQLYAAYPDERFRHFRKTHGYANLPLDGVWLRAPYLHNGSVPTLRDLLEPAAQRPATFFRGYDVFDPVKVGFVADVGIEPAESAEAHPQLVGKRYFAVDTRERPGADPRQRNWGNGNQGHEGPAYGTELPAADKDAIVEFLKTF